MARRRMLSASLSQSRRFAAVSTDLARLAYVLLIPHADREGRIDGDLDYLSGIVYTRLPWDYDEIAGALAELERVGLVRLYTADLGDGADSPVVQIERFLEHNKPHHKEPESEFPPPPTQEPEVNPTSSQSQINHAETLASKVPQSRSMSRSMSRSESGSTRKARGRYRARLLALAGPRFLEDVSEDDLDRWISRHDLDDLDRLYDASEVGRWPDAKDGRKARRWIYRDLLDGERSVPRDPARASSSEDLLDMEGAPL